VSAAIAMTKLNFFISSLLKKSLRTQVLINTNGHAGRRPISVGRHKYAFANRPLQMTFKAAVDKNYYIYN
jgi:hypothetical protein